MTTGDPSERRRRPLTGVAWLVGLLLVAGLLVAGGLLVVDRWPGSADVAPSAQSVNRFAEAAQAVVPTPSLVAAAAQAEADGDVATARTLDRIAAVPTGVWLTPEQLPAGRVGPYVSSVLASTAGRTVPLFVVYGIPDRDCTGRLSAGGLSADSYEPWVQEIALAAASGPSVVVLEPDALPGVVQCDGADERVRLLTEAVDTLRTADVTTYVDAGHSDWIPAPRMARLLREVGVGSVRGFSTNVSNYQPQGAELRYATDLSNALDGAHFVVDVGRSGDPDGAGEAVTDWCNPTGRALGGDPGFVDDGTPLDALLWVKPPAESDGECHGGPPAGDLWVERALELAAAAGW